jgi:hypothetical protein
MSAMAPKPRATLTATVMICMPTEKASRVLFAAAPARANTSTAC